MIKEIVQFVQQIPEDLKNQGVKPREGLHILLKIEANDTKEIFIDVERPVFEYYSKKILEESDFLKHCAFLSLNAWCIDTNKCFDTPAKGIHSCSPFCVAFKKENLVGGEKYNNNKGEQIYERFASKYFSKAWELLTTEEDKRKVVAFRDLFTQKVNANYFEKILNQIEAQRSEERRNYEQQINAIKEQQKEVAKELKTRLKEQLETFNLRLESVKELLDSDYIIFYLDVPMEKYKEVHQKYLADKLFNTNKYNTVINENGEIFGTSDFFNGYNGSMPFLIHQTASFDITGRISNKEALVLHEFQQILPRKTLPNPLPVFIFYEELQQEVLRIFKENGNKLGYKELIEQLWKKYREEVANYYLLYYQNTKDGLVFRDFDFVSNFEYELKDENGKAWEVKDLFEIDYKPILGDIFSFQNQIVQVIFNNNLIVKTKDNNWVYKYFDDIEEKWCKSSQNYILILKYRETFYNYIYKSQRQAVSGEAFDEILQVSILEDIRLDEYKNAKHSEYFNIRKKLSIWFSLSDKFNSKNKNMASNLIKYQDFVAQLAVGAADIEQATDEYFAFASGQVIEYVLQKSKTDDKSYLLLEPYLQQAKCSEFKRMIANDIARYKHAITGNETRFKWVCAFVQTWETSRNMKELLPELIAGIFSKNQFFVIKSETN